jgi:hypothetical protein
MERHLQIVDEIIIVIKTIKCMLCPDNRIHNMSEQNLLLVAILT